MLRRFFFFFFALIRIVVANFNLKFIKFTMKCTCNKQLGYCPPTVTILLTLPPSTNYYLGKIEAQLLIRFLNWILYMIILILIVLGKDDTICAVLVNAAMCLNLLGESEGQHPSNCTLVLSLLFSFIPC